MVTYQPFVYGLTKLDTGTNIGGLVHFISLTHQMINVVLSIQVSITCMQLYFDMCFYYFLKHLLMQEFVGIGDCHDSKGVKDMCVAGAIKNFTSQLSHYKEGTSDRRCKGAKSLKNFSYRNLDFFLIVWFHPFIFLILIADNMTEALLFLAHFTGDIHQVCEKLFKSPLFKCFLPCNLTKSFGALFFQPMHVGFTSDEGGNTIELRWYRHKSNLHHVSSNFLYIK